MAQASRALVMLLPTPPLPETTPMTFFTLLLGLGASCCGAASREEQAALQLEQSWVHSSLILFVGAAGKSVPEDFEIITSNDSPITSYTRPNLSSINHPLYDLGAVSMRMLTKIMNKEELEEKDVILNHGITLRQSTK